MLFRSKNDNNIRLACVGCGLGTGDTGGCQNDRGQSQGSDGSPSICTLIYFPFLKSGLYVPAIWSFQSQVIFLVELFRFQHQLKFFDLLGHGVP